jgi:hypothetical protein
MFTDEDEDDEKVYETPKDMDREEFLDREMNFYDDDLDLASSM